MKLLVISTCCKCPPSFSVSLPITLLSILSSSQHQYLGSDEEGREEVVLQLLVNLSSQCGVSFSSSSSSSSSPAGPPVNVLRDVCSLEVRPGQ